MKESTVINMAIQVLPQSEQAHPYAIVDKAIETIRKSGLKYKVCPFETVIEGTWDELMQVSREIQIACYENGATQMMTYMKIQSKKDEDVSINDKMEKYQQEQ